MYAYITSHRVLTVVYLNAIQDCNTTAPKLETHDPPAYQREKRSILLIYIDTNKQTANRSAKSMAVLRCNHTLAFNTPEMLSTSLLSKVLRRT